MLAGWSRGPSSFGGCHPARRAPRVLDRDLVPGRAVAEHDREAGPGPRDARIDLEPRAPQPEPEDRLEARPVHPRGRAGVPGPAAAADVRRLGIDVGRDDVGLDLVALDAGRRRGRGRSGSASRRARRPVAVAEPREGHDRPDRGVGVLAAVLAHARQVALDVAGIARRPVERRCRRGARAGRRAGPDARRRRPSRGAPASASAAPEITPTTARSNRCGTPRSTADPSGVPSSKNARRYHSPSQASSSTAASSAVACARHALRASAARRALGRAPPTPTRIAWRNQASQTLSPRPSAPTRFIPSFQSPVPISGSPWLPDARGCDRARARSARTASPAPRTRAARSSASCSPAASRGPSRNGTVSSRTPASPVTST